MKILAHINFADLDDFHMIMSKGKTLSMRAELIYTEEKILTPKHSS